LPSRRESAADLSEGYFAIANPNDDFTAMQNSDERFFNDRIRFRAFRQSDDYHLTGTDLMACRRLRRRRTTTRFREHSDFAVFDAATNPVPMPNSADQKQEISAQQSKAVKKRRYLAGQTAEIDEET
jgi:hypothetical protein